MQISLRLSSLSIVLAALISILPGATIQQVSHEEYDRWFRELSNWGRWGKEDQAGAVNLITPAKRKQAAALVKDGVSISLEHPEKTEKTSNNPPPFGHVMAASGLQPDALFVFDTYTVSFHGINHSHFDAL